MTVVLVTGMSGTGKSAALAELARRGHRAVDTDYGGWTEGEPGSERLWDEDRIDALLDEHQEGPLFIAGTADNQGKFYPRFDAVVLLSAPAEVILERIAARRSGSKSARSLRISSRSLACLPNSFDSRAGATAEIDTRAPLDEVVNALERIAGER